MSREAYGPRGPRGRGRRLIGPLRVAGIVTAVVAIAGAVAPQGAGAAFAAVLVGILVGAPVTRVGFLAARWWQIGDRRYAWWALTLLVIIAAGGTVAALS